jgi:hypothetical protein
MKVGWGWGGAASVDPDAAVDGVRLVDAGGGWGGVRHQRGGVGASAGLALRPVARREWGAGRANTGDSEYQFRVAGEGLKVNRLFK